MFWANPLAPARRCGDDVEMTSPFRTGLDLNAGFYADVVEPILRPWPHGCGLLGWGSDVLGYDTARSTDHGWGPRLQVFVRDEDVPAVAAAVERGLPEAYGGWPVRYGWDAVPVSHRVSVTTLRAWLVERLALDPRDGIGAIDWLVLPQQFLLGVVRGAVFADPDGQLADVRRRLGWYPRDVWLWLLACQWRRLDQEDPFAGRAAEVGDELGSAVIAAGRSAR